MEDNTVDFEQDDPIEGKSMWGFKFFRKKKPYYEFYLFSGNRTMADKQTKELQEEGWELAGSITPFMGKFDTERMLIPFKRKKK